MRRQAGVEADSGEDDDSDASDEEGNNTLRCFLVTEGCVSAEMDGKELAKFRKGNFFNETVLVVPGTKMPEFVATEDATLTSIGASVFATLFSKEAREAVDALVKGRLKRGEDPIDLALAAKAEAEQGTLAAQEEAAELEAAAAKGWGKEEDAFKYVMKSAHDHLLVQIAAKEWCPLCRRAGFAAMKQGAIDHEAKRRQYVR